MKIVDVIVAALLIIGGLNWGLVGIFQFDIIAALFGGENALISRLIYIVVGLAAVYQGLGWKAIQRRWKMAKI